MRMDELVALCKRRGFLYQSSEIYGGLNGFWDYGPMGVELKRNVREAWWREMVSGHNELMVPTGAPSAYQMVGIDCTIIMHPQVWKCSGHYDLFHDMKVECKGCRLRFRVDQVIVALMSDSQGKPIAVETYVPDDTGMGLSSAKSHRLEQALIRHNKELGQNSAGHIATSGLDQYLAQAGAAGWLDQPALRPACPECRGELTEPREFNLMFKTTVGALGGEEDVAFLRPETAQGIFVNFRNVTDSTRVKVPFGIAQMGKSFRNEITPRNFTFRSREFEQMEIEFFCHPTQSPQWYQYWRDRRYQWYLKLGLAGQRLRLRDHAKEELSHYSCGTADIEYAFPFLPAGEFGELEGVAHRGDFDLRSHMEGKLVRQGDQLVVETDAEGKPRHRGSGKDLSYFDEENKQRFVPHVIEPSAGADRATLAFLCEAYQEDEVPDENGKPTKRVLLRFHPRLAPIKAAVLPLVRKDGMPQIAQEIYGALKPHMNVFYDEKAAVGRRYRRQDEVGTPFCITVDGQTLEDGTVTFRDRDTLKQWRVKKEDCLAELQARLQG